jgi:hypothetical protein
MLALRFRDPESLAQRAGLTDHDAAFGRRIGAGRLRRHALVQHGRLLGVLRTASLLKLVMVGRLSRQAGVPPDGPEGDLALLQEYPVAVIAGQRGSTAALRSACHRVVRLPFGRRAELAVFLRRPRGIDARYVVLELLQRPVAQPFLHNPVSHTLQNLPGRRKGGAPPSPLVRSGPAPSARRNMIYVKLDDVTLRRGAGHVVAVADAGLHVNVGLFLFDMDVDDLARTMAEHPRITFAAHSGGWKHAFWANVLGAAPLTPAQLAGAERYQRSFFDQLSVQPSVFANLHFYALQQEAVPCLRRTGQCASIMYTDVAEDGTVTPGRGRRAASYALGRTGDGLLLVSGEDHSGWRYDPRNTWDVLKRTSSLSGRGDVAKGTERIYRAARNAFDLGMPAILSTHEFRLVRFRPDEVAAMFTTVLERLRRDGYDPLCVSETEFLAQLNGYLDRDGLALRGARP